MNKNYLILGVIVAGIALLFLFNPSKNISNRTAVLPGTMMPGSMMNQMDVSNDREFLEEMIPHHQEAIDTANEVLERGGEIESVKILAQNIITAQEREIADMKRWYKEWYGVEYSDNNSYTPMMRDLAAYSGRDIDLIFTSDMIMHHMGALHMASSLLSFTQREELRILGNNILKTQREEIILMQNILARNK